MKKMNPVIHFELPAKERNRMTNFYSNVFGWQAEVLGPEMNEYVLVSTTVNGENGMPKNPGAINGGIFEKTKGMPNYPTIVIAVDNLDESIDLVKKSGGRVQGEPDMIPGVGRFVYFVDTEGNVTGMLQPAVMN